MECPNSILLLILSFSVHLGFAFAAFPDFQFRCVPNGNFTGGATYRANLDRLSARFTSNNETNFGFYNFTVGGTPNALNVIGLCRGDIEQLACKNCLNNTVPELRRGCPNNTAAIGWSENCMLRYSDQNIFGSKATSPGALRRNNRNATSVDQFNLALSSMLRNLSRDAAAGSSLRKNAAENVTGPTYFNKIYAYVQCTPDLSQKDCNECLETAISALSGSFCYGRIGCRVLLPSCILRYESGPFLDAAIHIPPPSPPPPSSPPWKEGRGRNNTAVIVVVVASVVSALLLLLCIWVCLRVRKSREKDTTDDEFLKVDSLQYDFATIQAATNHFSDENKLGQGGFGVVYKGQLPNGQDVAVKRLSSGSGQGDSEFKNEVLLVANLQHRNLVRLIGFCLQGRERLLIYEFVPNASLDHFIFDPLKSAQLDWERRFRIIGGIARGILYLHEDSQLRVIHRDLKPSNILLDAEMNPKIADFGMARLFVVDETHGTTSRVVGTYGYMAPEYVKNGQFSVKTDVFSFGILVLEIVSSQMNNPPRGGEEYSLNLISLAWQHWRKGTPLNIVDSNLREGGSMAQIMKCIHIGLLCVQENVLLRPTMGSIVLMFTSDSSNLPTPSHPAFFMNNTTQSNMPSSRESHLVSASTNEVTITELDPR